MLTKISILQSRVKIPYPLKNGVMIALVPTTTKVLKILEPTIFEIAISLLPIKPAVILTLASGKLVPSATIVKPIITEGYF